MPEALEDDDELLAVDEEGDGDGTRRRGLDASQDNADGERPERGSGRKKARQDESAKGDVDGKESESSEDVSAAAEMRCVCVCVCALRPLRRNPYVSRLNCIATSEPSEGDYGEAHGGDGSE